MPQNKPAPWMKFMLIVSVISIMSTIKTSFYYKCTNYPLAKSKPLNNKINMKW